MDGGLLDLLQRRGRNAQVMEQCFKVGRSSIRTITTMITAMFVGCELHRLRRHIVNVVQCR
jgi:hypothetical protein